MCRGTLKHSSTIWDSGIPRPVSRLRLYAAPGQSPKCCSLGRKWAGFLGPSRTPGFCASLLRHPHLCTSQPQPSRCACSTWHPRARAPGGLLTSVAPYPPTRANTMPAAKEPSLYPRTAGWPSLSLRCSFQGRVSVVPPTPHSLWSPGQQGPGLEQKPQVCLCSSWRSPETVRFIPRHGSEAPCPPAPYFFPSSLEPGWVLKLNSRAWTFFSRKAKS